MINKESISKHLNINQCYVADKNDVLYLHFIKTAKIVLHMY